MKKITITPEDLEGALGGKGSLDYEEFVLRYPNGISFSTPDDTAKMLEVFLHDKLFRRNFEAVLKVLRNKIWLRRLLMVKCVRTRMDLSLLRAPGSTFDLSIMRESSFRNAFLQGSSFVGADLQRADFCCASLRGSRFVGADLTFADLSEADLRGADLSFADLRGATLQDTVLWDADLSFATIFRSALEQAQTLGAFLDYAIIIDDKKEA